MARCRPSTGRWGEMSMKGRRDGFRIPNRLSACASGMLHLARSTAVPFGLRTPPRISAVHQGLRRQQPRRSGRCDGRQLTRHTSLHALIHFVWSWMAQRIRWSATVLFYGIAQHEERIKSAFFFLAQGWPDRTGDVNRLLGQIVSVNQIHPNM